jgi:hypothetical protein
MLSKNQHSLFHRPAAFNASIETPIPNPLRVDRPEALIEPLCLERKIFSARRRASPRKARVKDLKEPAKLPQSSKGVTNEFTRVTGMYRGMVLTLAQKKPLFKEK